MHEQMCDVYQEIIRSTEIVVLTPICHSIVSNPFVPSMIAVDDKTVKIWDAVTGHVKATLEGHSEGVMAVAISHDGATIVSGSSE